ncbi:hypothetical protein CNR22_01805 [Sphingobacteriaceae bacterium]|nr:hypothetical protein CNR22_01805 [Sphingobacteriaceae bacterium]
MNKLRIAIIILLLAVAVNALMAGYSFIADPSGKGLNISIALLRHSPFHDFFIPGLILFLVNGLANIFTAMFLLNQWRNAYLFVMIQGILLTGWILVQVIMLVQFNALHAILGAVGLFFFAAGWKLHNKVSCLKVSCFPNSDEIRSWK